MKDRTYWKGYVLAADPAEIERAASRIEFYSAGEIYDLLRFDHGAGEPVILLSPGAGPHPWALAELAFRVWQRGYTVFVMPCHRGATVGALVRRHDDALRRIAAVTNDRIGVYADGVGGHAAFYLALAHGPMRSLVCQNAPAILDEQAYHQAIFAGPTGQRRHAILPVAKVLAKVAPRVTLPMSTYVDVRELVDPDPRHGALEAALAEAYAADPDFDHRYPLSAISSLLATPAPAPLAALEIPTMFIVPIRGIVSAYTKNLFARLPPIDKKLVELDGGALWTASHPGEAARIVCDWFDATLATRRLAA